MRLNIVAAAVLAVCATFGSGLVRAADPMRTAQDEASERARLFAQLESTDFIREGAATPQSVVYVFIDPNCMYCHFTWKALQAYEAVGLQVRWVAVAYQQESSVGRAAAILGASNRAAALKENELGYRLASYDGGIEPAQNVSERVTAQLQANMQLMRAFGAPGSPLLVWKDANGVVRIKIGMPHLLQLPILTGLPMQIISDPELQKFQ